MLPPIIDSHVHWRDPDSNRYATLSDNVDADGNRGGSTAETYLPRDYLNDANGLEIKGCVHIEAEWDKSDPTGETAWLHSLLQSKELVDKHVAIIGYADLSRADVERTLATHAIWPNTRGIRQILNRIKGRPELCWANQEYVESSIWCENFKLLEKYDLDFDLMCFAHQLKAMYQIASQNANTRIHLEHAALPWDHSPEGRQIWKQSMKEFAELEHVDVKISGLGNTIPIWNVGSIREYVLNTIDIFGTNRVSFASNFPTDAKFSSMLDIWNAFDAITVSFTDEEREAMFSENALRAYRMEVAAT